MNEEGITLVTTLLALAIIAVSLPLLSFLLNKLPETKLYDDIKYEQFFHFVKDDVLRAKNVQAINDTLVFEVRTGEIATLSLYNDIIRRQVDQVGHEVYVRDVKTFKTNQSDHYLRIELTSSKGEVYEKTIPFH